MTNIILHIAQLRSYLIDCVDNEYLKVEDIHCYVSSLTKELMNIITFEDDIVFNGEGYFTLFDRVNLSKLLAAVVGAKALAASDLPMHEEIQSHCQAIFDDVKEFCMEF